MFKEPKAFEFNHIRGLRLTLYRSLKKIEEYDNERLQMADTLIKHQNDIETGKIVAQIIHDLKSPLSVFEELLHEKNIIEDKSIYKKSNLALMKIYTLIESIRDPKTEKLLNKQKKYLIFRTYYQKLVVMRSKRCTY